MTLQSTPAIPEARSMMENMNANGGAADCDVEHPAVATPDRGSLDRAALLRGAALGVSGLLLSGV